MESEFPMTKRMLIDATHAEETRVVVLDGNRLEDFDFETSTKKQLKGNIYLAKVTRVEPSLQAAFVDYGGNRHGFLAFNEIHPDYYQIPVADRQALAEEERAEAEARDAADDEKAAGGQSGHDKSKREKTDDGEDDEENGAVEMIGGDDAEDLAPRRRTPLRRYKIQEVIKRRQILLVQVVKEERGNKGAALTTYLSLAGRFCVLMPNTARGGGISRKIVNPEDRKRLKAIASELPVPEGVGVILRTAGLGRSRAEIKRDFNYLIKLWDQIRETTLESVAPALVHEEANLIKRAIRDLYSRDIEEVLVEGEEGYRMAKQFMRMLMPSHAKRVIQYNDRIPLFHRYQVENQLDAMHSPIVHLKSGGYIVINPTEALVAIDVNSGRATRERNIEETAFRTNLEAAEEIARELRLRDLSGLIVIDFIDMDEPKNNRTVERRFKEAVKNDRARIQIGRISAFGLLELSRQRLRPSLLEASTQVCPHCGGSGHIRSIESTALHVLRAIEDEGIRERSSEITIFVPTAVALYVLNQKREMLTAIEERYAFRVFVASDDDLIPPDYRLDRVRGRSGDEKSEKPAEEAAVETPPAEDAEKSGRRRRRGRGRRGRDDEAATETTPGTTTEDATPVAEAADGAAEETASEELAAAEAQPNKRRRRGKRGGRRRRGAAARATETQGAEAPSADTQTAEGETIKETTKSDADAPVVTEAPEIVAEAETAAVETKVEEVSVEEAPVEEAPGGEAPVEAVPTEEAKPARRPRRRRKPAAEAASEAVAEAGDAAEAQPEKPKRRRAPRRKAAASESPAETGVAEAVKDDAEIEAPATPKPRAPRKRATRKTAASAKSVKGAKSACTPDEKPATVPDAGQPIAIPASPEPSPTAPADGEMSAPAPAPEKPRDEEPRNEEAQTAKPKRASRRGWWQRLVE